MHFLWIVPVLRAGDADARVDYRLLIVHTIQCSRLVSHVRLIQLTIADAYRCVIRHPVLMISRKRRHRFSISVPSGIVHNARNVLLVHPTRLQCEAPLCIGAYVLTFVAHDVHAAICARAGIVPRRQRPGRIRVANRRSVDGVQRVHLVHAPAAAVASRRVRPVYAVALQGVDRMDFLARLQRRRYPGSVGDACALGSRFTAEPCRCTPP